MLRVLRFSLPVAVAVLAFALPLRVGAEVVAFELREFFDDYYSSGAMAVQGQALLTERVLAEFYARRGYRPAWGDPALVAELFDLLARSVDDGLDPDDYNLTRLRALRERAASSPKAVPERDLELLYTSSLLRFAYHQRFGKVNPKTLVSTWNFGRQLAPGVDAADTMNQIVESGSLREGLAARVPRGPLYRNIQMALARYRSAAAAGGWEPVPEGVTLTIGMRDERVVSVRRRLAVTGDLETGAVSDPELFDADLESGVRRFQHRHSLSVDGAVGPATVRAMNVSVEERIDQLRLSLERARWIMTARDTSVVVVNIAAAEVYVLEEGEMVWQRRAMVGRTYRQTPVFRGLMTYLEINPTWTVPPGILRADILPKVREDPGYLARSNMTLLDRSGRAVDPYAVDWQALEGMPYIFRQEPGPTNALGLIKFMFPNEHFVFIHDTPNRELFERAERTFSSGCIRVEDPFSLAALLLRDPANWDEAAVRAAVETGETRRVRLADPWPVYILYWTAQVDDDGVVRFYPDVYQRDVELLGELDGDVRIDLPAS
jgi:murein L,D-transpeptidase YcbB/YkuD